MTSDPNRLVSFTMDGVAYKGRPVLVQEIRRHLPECTVTGKIQPPDALHKTIQGQSEQIEVLQGKVEDMKEALTDANAREAVLVKHLEKYGKFGKEGNFTPKKK